MKTVTQQPSYLVTRAKLFVLEEKLNSRKMTFYFPLNEIKYGYHRKRAIRQNPVKVIPRSNQNKDVFAFAFKHAVKSLASASSNVSVNSIHL